MKHDFPFFAVVLSNFEPFEFLFTHPPFSQAIPDLPFVSFPWIVHLFPFFLMVFMWWTLVSDHVIAFLLSFHPHQKEKRDGIEMSRKSGYPILLFWSFSSFSLLIWCFLLFKWFGFLSFEYSYDEGAESRWTVWEKKGKEKRKREVATHTHIIYTDLMDVRRVFAFCHRHFHSCVPTFTFHVRWGGKEKVRPGFSFLGKRKWEGNRRGNMGGGGRVVCDTFRKWSIIVITTFSEKWQREGI